MWPWHRKVLATDPVIEDMRHVEADCLRRLAFVDAHLQRALHADQPWARHLTVSDADIVPAGRSTQVLSTISDPANWPWWLVLLIGIAAIGIISAIVAVLIALN